MKSIFISAAIVIAASSAAGGLSEVLKSDIANVVWTPANDTLGYTQTFQLTGDLRGARRLCFCQQNPVEFTSLDDRDSVLELFPGYYAVESEKFRNATGSDTLEFSLRSRYNFNQRSYGPDGMHLVMTDGSVAPVSLEIADLLADPSRYSTIKRDRMSRADMIYEFNREIYPEAGTVGIYDVVPSFKEVRLPGGESEVDLDNIHFSPLEKGRNEEYRISVKDGKIFVLADKNIWHRLEKRIHHFFGRGKKVIPDAIIADWPDLPHRGLHIDVARNWQEPDEIIKVLDLMAIYGLNRLHFHLVDDEAWRIRIAALPELTEIGSKRGYSETGYHDYLPQRYGGDPLYVAGNPDPKRYLTKDDYMRILRHAGKLGIQVIPEIEAPGHGRAAIMAMKERAKRTGDTSLLLSREGDSSRYTSAQGYHDDVMDPTLPGVYKFLTIVIDEIMEMHSEAGVPLPAIHIGGDEVATGAWNGNAHVARLMKDENLKSDEEVHAWFMKRLADIFKARNLKFMAWQEVAEDHGEEYDSILRPLAYGVNLWFGSGYRKGIEKVARSGYPLIISNVDRFYLDMTYSGHPDEKGLNWGGNVDEFKSLGGYPRKICDLPDARIVGVQGQLWAEAIRSSQDLESQLLPKMLGMAERAWNNDSTYSDRKFNAVVEKEFPQWDSLGVTYHIRQPGILVKGDTAIFNSPYRTGVIIYTFDGTDPVLTSSKVENGESVLVPSDCRQIRARLWIGDVSSPATLLWLSSDK